MKRLAVFASGNGSNFEAIVCGCERGEVAAEVVLMVCDRPGAYVVERARAHGVPAFVFDPHDFATKAEYETRILEELRRARVDLICLAGYMRIVSQVLLEPYEGRMVNIHPSLLPAFKGAHAIRDAFEYGVKVFGVTIHFVDSGMDSGRIVSQTAVPYEGGDMAELETMIHAAEHELYNRTINKLIKERII